jgi:hypothetical protein
MNPITCFTDRVNVGESARALLPPTSDECPSIAIDLGGTIEDSWQSKRRWFASKGIDIGSWPRSRQEVIQIIGDAGLYEQMVGEVYNDDNVFSREPVHGVASALEVLAAQFKIVIVSSRSERQRATTVRWLERHRLNRFVNDIILLGNDADKLAWCCRSGVQVLIDDDLRHIEHRDARLLTRIHFSARPFNTHRTRGIVVATSWQDIVAIMIAPGNAEVPVTAGLRAD